MHHPRAAPRPPLFAIFAGLAMMPSPKVRVLSPKVGVSTQALAQPAVGVLGRRRAPRERRLGARKGACWTSVVGARESPFPTLFCPLAQIRLIAPASACASSESLNMVTPHHGQPKTSGRLHSCLNAELRSAPAFGFSDCFFGLFAALLSGGYSHPPASQLSCGPIRASYMMYMDG